MQINSCFKCGAQPKLVTSAEFAAAESILVVEHHIHDLAMARLKCECGEGAWHPIEGREPMINEWNSKQDSLRQEVELIQAEADREKARAEEILAEEVKHRAAIERYNANIRLSIPFAEDLPVV